MGPVLLVEDDADIQRLLRLFLAGEGVEVHSVFNGREALDYLRDGKPAAVILLDLMMPVLDGYEFLEEFYSEESREFRRTPIIVLSAAADVEKVARARDVEFVKKPIDLDRLLEMIRALA